MTIAVQTEGLWPDPITGPLLLRVSFAATEDGLSPVGVELWAEPPPGPGTSWAAWNPALVPTAGSLDWRSVRIPLTRLTAEMTAEVAHHWRVIREQPLGAVLAGTVKAHRPGGRPPLYPPEHWEAVAALYQGADPRAPSKAIAQVYCVTRSTAWKWVSRCRRLGLLPPAQGA